MTDDHHYRRGVGVMLLNADKLVSFETPIRLWRALRTILVPLAQRFDHS